MMIVKIISENSAKNKLYSQQSFIYVYMIFNLMILVDD